MPSTCVVGLQWGDEAKGKIVDVLCDHHDVVVRYQGGANAGHTVVADGVTYKLSLIPSGILHPRMTCVLGNGVVVDPAAFLAEIQRLEKQGLSVADRLLLSDRAHLILPYHVEEERLTEESRSESEKLGTTRRGIGPCYRDKVGRSHALRVCDLAYPDRFREHLGRVVVHKNRLLGALLPEFKPFDAPAMSELYLDYAERLRPFIADTTAWLHRALSDGRRLLFEGAQGALLDIDHGSFPYVTSSSSSGAGLAAGSGVPARHVERWIGVIKAYTTRVGGGPFPTELTDAIGERIRTVGREFGTVTGRPRRCGWFDAVAAGYSARVTGATELSLMLLDVLTGIDPLRVAVAYEDDAGRRVSDFPAHLSALERCHPVYETLPGWSEDVTGARSWSDLPQTARDYVRFLTSQLGVSVRYVSVGPDREQTIRVHD